MEYFDRTDLQQLQDIDLQGIQSKIRTDLKNHINKIILHKNKEKKFSKQEEKKLRKDQLEMLPFNPSYQETEKFLEDLSNILKEMNYSQNKIKETTPIFQKQYLYREGFGKK